MRTSIDSKRLWFAAALVPGFLLVAAAAPRSSAQGQITPTNQSSAENSQTPADVVDQLYAMQAQITQLKSRLDVLTASAPAPIALQAHVVPTESSITGVVSCAHCQGIQPLHKGYTPYSWALSSVSQGDDIVLVANDKTYKLEGTKDQLLKFMSAKARVTGQLLGNDLTVESIRRAAKNE